MELSAQSCDECVYCIAVEQTPPPCCPSGEDSEQRESCSSNCRCQVDSTPFINIWLTKTRFFFDSSQAYSPNKTYQWDSVPYKPPFPPPKHQAV